MNKKGREKGGKIVHTIVLFELIKGKKFRPKKGRAERITKKNTDYQPSLLILQKVLGQECLPWPFYHDQVAWIIALEGSSKMKFWAG